MAEKVKRPREPKYKSVLDKLARQAESKPPGTRLPTVRELMAQHRVSQAAIERCLDELVRRGLVRRERGRGLFVDGFEPKSKVIGLYTDEPFFAPLSSRLFLQGLREAAGGAGFHVADFGVKDYATGHREMLAAISETGLAGIIADLSTISVMNLEADRQLVDLLREMRLPLVTSRPIPGLQADSVIPDYFGAFRELGEHLKTRKAGPVIFLGHEGLPSLARLYGLRAGVGRDIPVHSEILDKYRKGAWQRVEELKQGKATGSLVIGVPPDEPGEAVSLRGIPWRAGSAHELAVVLECGQSLPERVSAHVVVKPSQEMGRVAAELLLRRLRGFRGDMCHEVVPNLVRLA
ncbi:MAG: GntR family transcriptional regulator [Kiritimatiellae bacterium]|nr:GntR family transcriptional regulator [Kiritimatiellia bacterium]